MDPESQKFRPDQEDQKDQKDQTSEKRISNWELGKWVLISLFSMITTFFDVTTDLILASSYWTNHQRTEFWWTTIFIALPIIVTTTITCILVLRDGEYKSIFWISKIGYILLAAFISILQVVPIIVFVVTLRYAWRSYNAGKKGNFKGQREWHHKILEENSDAAIFKMSECFLESAPQLVLQLSLMIEGRANIQTAQIFSVVTSLISMGLCLISYRRARRFNRNKKDISTFNAIILFLCQFLVAVSRILSIAVVAYLFPLCTVIACVIHLLVMTGWLFYDKLSEPTVILKIVTLGLPLGFVDIFAYVPIVSDQPKKKNIFIFHYTIHFVENTVCTILWYFCADPSVRNSSLFQLIIILITVPYLLGIISMAFYYKFLHPTVGILNKPNEVATSEKTNSST